MAHVDVISDILAAAVRAFPHSEFVQGLSHQYLVRGSLSKRQLEGLYQKAERIPALPPGKLATLEAIILKRHKKYRSDRPVAAPLFEKDEECGRLIQAVLERYPQHKRVLFFQAKYQANEPLGAAEQEELKRFYKLLVK